jgi:hypothetical protein
MFGSFFGRTSTGHVVLAIGDLDDLPLFEEGIEGSLDFPSRDVRELARVLRLDTGGVDRPTFRSLRDFSF